MVVSSRVNRALSACLLLLLLGACGGKSEKEAVAAAAKASDAGQWNAAIIHLKTALQEHPGSGELRLLLGVNLLRSEDPAGAAIELERARELGVPNDRAVPPLAQALVKSREFAKLIGQFGNLRLDDPRAVATLQVALASAYAAQGAADEALRAVARAVEAVPDSVEARLEEARLKAASDHADEALLLLESLAARAPADADVWRLRGEILLQSGSDPNSVVAAFEKSLALRPNQPEIHAHVMALHFQRGDEQAARRQFEAMKATLPNHPLTRLFDAQVAFSKGDFKRARELFRELIAAAPDNAMLQYFAGVTELQLGAVAAAETYLQRAVQQDPRSVAARLMLARTYLRGSKPDRAFATLSPLLDRPGADAETIALAAQAQLLAGRSASATSLFERASKAKPTDARTRTALAVGQLAKGQTDAAERELQAIAAADEGVTAELALVSLRLSRRDFDAALRAVDQLQKKLPANPATAELRGRVHLERGNLSAARASFDDSLKLDPGYVPAIIRLAAIDVLQKKPAEAKARLSALVARDPRNVQALLSAAELARTLQSSPAEIERLLRDAVAADPTDARTHVALASHLTSVGDVKGALAAAQAGVTTAPSSIEVQDIFGRALLGAGDTNQASAVFAKLTTRLPDSPIGFIGAAEAALARRDFEAAERAAARARELDPRSIEAQQLAIHAALGQKRPQQAIAIVRDMQARRPKDALPYILEGEIELRQGRWNEAIAVFRKASTRDNPAQSPARLHFALMQAGRSAEAVRFSEDWLSRRPRDTLFLLYLADAAMKRGDDVEVERRYEQVLKLAPDNLLALNNLASLRTRQNRPGAVALAERAVKAAPDKAATLDTLAQALVSEGALERAIETQKRAVTLAPNSPVFRLNLAKIYVKAGKRSAAADTLAPLRNAGRPYPEQAEVEALLKTLGRS